MMNPTYIKKENVSLSGSLGSLDIDLDNKPSIDATIALAHELDHSNVDADGEEGQMLNNETKVEKPVSKNAVPSVKSAVGHANVLLDALQKAQDFHTYLFTVLSEKTDHVFNLVVGNDLPDDHPEVVETKGVISELKKLMRDQSERIERLQNMVDKDNGMLNHDGGNKKVVIPTEAVPAFDVIPNLTLTPSDDEGTVSDFVVKFKRMFIRYNVSIEEEWLFYLGISFTKNTNFYYWFESNLNSPRNPIKSWSKALELLEYRFDYSKQLGVHERAQNLIKFRPDDNESMMHGMKRFDLMMRESQIKEHPGHGLESVCVPYFCKRRENTGCYGLWINLIN